MKYFIAIGFAAAALVACGENAPSGLGATSSGGVVAQTPPAQTPAPEEPPKQTPPAQEPPKQERPQQEPPKQEPPQQTPAEPTPPPTTDGGAATCPDGWGDPAAMTCAPGHELETRDFGGLTCGRCVPPPDGGAGMLRWYFTCGDPVCGGYTPSGNPPCSGGQREGTPCSNEGQLCDPRSGCNQQLVCDDSDPTMQPGGCPISLASAKRDVRYLDAEELRRYHDELLHIRLASYRYVGSAADRLGFVIDDRPASISVLPNGRQVDVYGYASMAVAALQVQAGRIAVLEAKLRALEPRLAAPLCE